MEDENAGVGEGNHSQAKKTKLSDERNKLESSTTAAAEAVADVVEESHKQLLQPSTPSEALESACPEDTEGDTKMSEPDNEDGFCKDNPIPTVGPPEENEPSNMSVEDETVSSPPVVKKQSDGKDVPIEGSPAEAEANATNAEDGNVAASVGGAVEDASAAAAPAAAAADGDVDPEVPAAGALAAERRNRPNRPRNRFRGRNYRLRSNSSGSERAAQDDSNDDPDVEAMIRRLVDEINQENANGSHDDDDNNGNNDDDDADDDDGDDNSDTSSADSDDSDSSPAVSADDDDDDDSDDSDNEGGSENNANEQIDVESLHFMQTAGVKNNWNYFRDIQLRSLGLSFRNKASLGGLGYKPYQFQSRAYGSKHLVERLEMSHRLCKHEGCVNSLNFNSAGTLLASGSDDLKINLWNWQTNKLMQSISSGHRANVFQTKFVDASGYRGEIEIISTGRDGQVRQIRVGPAGEVKRTVLFKQSQPIHKIAIPARCPFEFLTACEDGVVKSYDLRDNVAKRVTNAKKRLYSISTHPLDNEFCVSGNDESVRVYDRRNPSKPMKYHYAAHMKTKKEYLTVTCAVYNSTGTEILASYSDEDVFLFDNVNHEDGKFLHRYSGHCNMKTIKGVNFFGPNSEFVVSGSDCGNIFFWDKESEIIVNWLHGDESGVVNCLEPHPEFPIMATSGLDDDAKIWVPRGPDDEHESPVFSREGLEKCVRRNLRIRQTSRCASFSEDRILDFLMFSRQGIGGRLRRHFSSDSEDQADGDGNGGGAGGGGRRGGRRGARGAGGGGAGGAGAAGDGAEDDDENRMILRCNPS
ncbi:DDB1- and CUL4-associated factor 8 [Ochlerotatus camptorhynchus]|uniref:DDB1- and CUL4-associated factor 8 n=1 Tax=Ochlerotatus camptorhynchus TaxID=644619 RepID=UPI0031D30980